MNNDSILLIKVILKRATLHQGYYFDTNSDQGVREGRFRLDYSHDDCYSHSTLWATSEASGKERE